MFVVKLKTLNENMSDTHYKLIDIETCHRMTKTNTGASLFLILVPVESLFVKLDDNLKYNNCFVNSYGVKLFFSQT